MGKETSPLYVTIAPLAQPGSESAGAGTDTPPQLPLAAARLRQPCSLHPYPLAHRLPPRQPLPPQGTSCRSMCGHNKARWHCGGQQAAASGEERLSYLGLMMQALQRTREWDPAPIHAEQNSLPRHHSAHQAAIGTPLRWLHRRTDLGCLTWRLNMPMPCKS